jgi:IS5 family transposase
MFRVLVLQTLYTLSDDQTEYQVRDRLSFMRFVGLELHDRVPDAKTIWLFRETLVRAGAFEALFRRFDAMLRIRGWLATGGQIVDATVIEARRPRLSRDEKAVIKSGGTPAGWSKAKTAQIDRDGRWTIKRGRRAPEPGAEGPAKMDAAQRQLLTPYFGYKNHIGIDQAFGFVRTFKVTPASAHDGAQLVHVLDAANTASTVWADTAYRSKANLEMLARRGMKEAIQRPKPRGKPMPANIRRGNATRAKVRCHVEHVFAAQKHRIGLIVRTVGIARARAKIALANLAYNFQRLAWLQGRGVPA